MTLSEKINKLTWFSEVIKLKDILKDLLTQYSTLSTNITNLTADVLDLQENPVDSRPYKSYVALLLGDDDEVPTATILENTLGENVTITNPEVGEYKFTFETIATLNVFVPYVPSIQGYTSRLTRAGDSISINFVDIDNENAPINVSFSNTPIEIRIYS